MAGGAGAPEQPPEEGVPPHLADDAPPAPRATGGPSSSAAPAAKASEADGSSASAAGSPGQTPQPVLVEGTDTSSEEDEVEVEVDGFKMTPLPRLLNGIERMKSVGELDAETATGSPRKGTYLVVPALAGRKPRQRRMSIVSQGIEDEKEQMAALMAALGDVPLEEMKPIRKNLVSKLFAYCHLSTRVSG